MIPFSDQLPSRIFPIATLLIIGVTIYVFWLQITAPDPEAFIYTWALIPQAVDFADPGTLYPFLASIYLHGGLLHILSNMWFLFIFGDNVEAALGRVKYLLFYLSGGVIAALTQYYFSSKSAVPMLGASGAVAAVLGYYFIKFPYSRIKTLVPFFGLFFVSNLSAGVMLLVWFLLQILSGAASLNASADSGGVAWWAHIGGFLFGVIIAMFSKNNSRNNS